MFLERINVKGYNAYKQRKTSYYYNAKILIKITIKILNVKYFYSQI